MTQCSSFSDVTHSEILLNLDKQPHRPTRFTGHRNHETELSPWQDHGHPEGQSSITGRSGSDLKSVVTLCRERTRPERMTSANSFGVTPRWEEIARRQYEQQRTAAGLDPGLSYFRHFVDGDPALSMRSYRKRCTVEDAGSSVLTFDQLDEDEDPYLRKFRISGDLNERLRLLMLITNSSSMATVCASVNNSNVRLHSTTKAGPEQNEQRSRTRRPDPRPSTLSTQPPQSPAAPQLYSSKSTISASLPVRSVPAQPDQVLRSSSNTGSGKPDVDDCADRMTSFREAVFSYVRDTQRPLLAARSGPGPGPASDGSRPITRQHSQVPKCQTGYKSMQAITPNTQRTSSVIADYRMTLTGAKADPGSANRKRAESSRAIMARYVVKPGLMRQTVSSSARKRYIGTNCSPRTTGAPFQGGNDNTMFVRLG